MTLVFSFHLATLKKLVFRSYGVSIDMLQKHTH